MASITLTITVPDDVVTAITAWRQLQFQADGLTLKYSTNLILLREIIKGAVQSILEQSPTPAIATAKSAIVTQTAAIQALKDGAVT